LLAANDGEGKEIEPGGLLLIFRKEEASRYHAREVLLQPEAALHSAKREAKKILKRKCRKERRARAQAEATSRPKAKPPKVAGSPGTSDRRKEQANQGRAMPTAKGSTRAVGSQRPQKKRPEKPWRHGCVLLGCQLKRHLTVCEAFMGMLPHQRLVTVVHRDLCLICFRHSDGQEQCKLSPC
jgi:hypothetical protein